MEKQHSLMMFRESLGSEKTRTKYEYLVKLFRDYHEIKDFDSIIKIDPKELQKMVETYVIHIKKTVNPNTVPSYVNPIKTFLETNDIDLNWRKIKRLYPTKIKRSGSSAYQTEDVKKMLEVTPQLRNKAIIHFLASTGVRVGAIEDLRIRHLRDMPLGCKSVLIYEDSTEEYNTFLTPEATTALEQYHQQRQKDGETFTENTPLFRAKYQLGSANVKPLDTPSIQMVIHRAVKNASLLGQKKNNRYSTQLAHGFRKRFNTILKLNNNVNDSAIESMMGHSHTISLDSVYFDGNVERIFDEFAKGIGDLTINQEEKQKAEIAKFKEEQNAVEKVQAELEEMRRFMKDFVSKQGGKTLDIDYYQHTNPEAFDTKDLEYSDEDQK